MHLNITHVAVLAVPLLVRSIAHHLYHRACHALIHKAGHKVSVLGKLLSRFKWLMDIALVGCLAIFGAATEPKEHHDHEADPHD